MSTRIARAGRRLRRCHYVYRRGWCVNIAPGTGVRHRLRRLLFGNLWVHCLLLPRQLWVDRGVVQYGGWQWLRYVRFNASMEQGHQWRRVLMWDHGMCYCRGQRVLWSGALYYRLPGCVVMTTGWHCYRLCFL